MNQLLQKLTETPGISGHEGLIRKLISELITDHVDDMRVDALGNLIAFKRGNVAPDQKVLLDAHMDEVGFVVTSVERDGTCKFAPVGGFDERTLPGKVVEVGSKRLTGVIGLKPVHLTKRQERRRIVRMSAMRIDIGAKNKSDGSKRVKVGDPAVFASQYEETGVIAMGKAFDDRVGCAALIELLRGEPYPYTLVAAFTVQEEVGLRGAQVVARAVKPALALVLEGTPAYDLPRDRDIGPNVVLGKGVSIYVMDGGTLSDPRLIQHITRIAAANNIPYQIRQPGGGRTNAAAIQRSHAAVPVATIAVPVRYPHSPVSMINLGDYQHLVTLANVALRELDLDAPGRSPEP